MNAEFLLDPFVRTLNRNLLKHSAGTAIFCQCGQVADCRRWVVASHGERTIGLCCTCWDKALAAKPALAGCDIIDGRVIFKRAKPQKAWRVE